jgi:hypothetical protein
MHLTWFVIGVTIATVFAGNESRTVELMFDNVSGAVDSCLFNAGAQAHAQAFSICVTDGNQFASPTPGSAGLYVQTYDSDVYVPELGVDQPGWHYLAVSLTGSQLSVDFDDGAPSGFIWNGTSYSSLSAQPFTLPNEPSTVATPIDIGGPGWVTGGMVQVDEAAVYTPAISSTQLDAHYQAAFGQPAPTVTGVSPAQGSTDGGTQVAITGTNFAVGSTVSFGGTAATSVVVNSATSITATSPSRTSASDFGAVDVVVESNGLVSATSSADLFAYVSQSSVTGRVLEGNPGTLITGPVAAITDPDQNTPVTAFHATINWGDGTPTSAGAIARSQTTPTQLTITGAHRYAGAGTWPIVVTLRKDGANTRTATALAEVYGSKFNVAAKAVAGPSVGLLTFQTKPGGGFHACTATVVDTPNVSHGGNMSLVLTAGHCVFGDVFGDRASAGLGPAFFGTSSSRPATTAGTATTTPPRTSPARGRRTTPPRTTPTASG